ncbi:MAG: class I SAM-dependent methyltransferase family protein [DPANN group archaeon]|nr:class I SAM-dependent methyltransferase family protein [DPANN group archaeon]
MVVCLKVKKIHGEDAKQFLREKGWLDTERLIGKTEKMYLILPIAGRFDKHILLKKFPGSKFEEKNLQKIPPHQTDLKHLLKNILTEEQIGELVRSYDVIGDIAILEIPPRLDRLAVSIAWAFKRAFPYIGVVARKMGKVGSADEEYRLRKYEILTGERRLETMHKEGGLMMHTDLGKAYFSPRSSRERERVAGLVKNGEQILVMFAGIGPFALVIASKNQNTQITAIEINPDAFKFMEENIRLNRLGFAINPVLGDVNEVLPKLGQKFDRIIMPFPEKSWDFLELAIKYANKNSTIHFYAFVREDKLNDAEEKIKKIAEKEGRHAKILRVLKAGSYAPKTWRYVFDVKIK